MPDSWLSISRRLRYCPAMNSDAKPSAESTHTDPAWAWSVFWQADRIEACVPRGNAGTDQAIASRWQQFFSGLPAKAKVLDLGTGNGALALHAMRASRDAGLDLEFHGVDSADVDPQRFAVSAHDLLARARFHSRTAMERLPFPDACFDAVCSQFGLEYSRLEDSVPELSRVLRPDGAILLLMHDAQSAVAGRNAMQWRQCERLLSGSLFGSLDRLLNAIFDAQEDDSEEALVRARRAIQQFTDVAAGLEQEAVADADADLVDRVLSAARQIPGLRLTRSRDELLSESRALQARVQAQAERFRAMTHAALDGAGLARLIDDLGAAGIAVAEPEMARAGTQNLVVGIWLSGRKTG
jgi:SAM-dependent methyltransferase